MKIWKALNSPITITCLVLFAAIFLLQSRRNYAASEIRGVYEELMSILEESSESDRQMVVRNFVEELSSEIVGGFHDAFQSGSEENSEKFRQRIETRKEIKISKPRYAPQSWEGREAYVFSVTNNSGVSVSDITLNYSFLREGILIDADTEEIREIEILLPGASVSLKAERSFDEKAEMKNTSDQLEIAILDLKVRKI